MSAYSRKGRGWKYDFTLAGQRYTSKCYKTKGEARQAEARKREELQNPQPESQAPEKTQTDMAFLELVNKRLDFVQTYNSKRHYQDYCYYARRWTKRWKGLTCGQITRDMIEAFILVRKRQISPQSVNCEIRYLRATFNWGKKRGLVKTNPLDGIEFLPVHKKEKYVPPLEDIVKVISMADCEVQDYLWTIVETMGRVGEINRLTWDDVDFDRRTVTLYTRKKRGGHLTPRRVPMTRRLHAILDRRHAQRDQDKPWVFWHTYRQRSTGKTVSGPYRDRKSIMRALCGKAEVKYFCFHALRHAGASIMDSHNVPMGAIQRILGHENRKTTEVYLHSIGQTEREAIETFERVREIHTQIHTQT